MKSDWTLDTKRLPAGAVLVVGAGLAGLYMALKLAPRPVFVLTSRRSRKGSASAWAQGGKTDELIPLIPAIRPFNAINKTAESPIKAPPKADARGVNSVTVSSPKTIRLANILEFANLSICRI